jgi:putative transposase
MKRRAYQTDLSDAEWSCIEPHLPAPEPGGRPRVHALREVLNAVFYVLLRSGCAWRLLPHDLERPGRASTTTSAYGVSTGPGRSSTLCHPSAPPGSPRTGSSTQRGHRRFAVGEEHGRGRGSARLRRGQADLKGRKRHILVDTEGFLLAVKVHAANVFDRDGIKLLC